jgi:hypothetical protein
MHILRAKNGTTNLFDVLVFKKNAKWEEIMKHAGLMWGIES